MTNMNITGEQACALGVLLARHAHDDADVLLTRQGLGALVVAFDLATFEISAGGTVDEL